MGRIVFANMCEKLYDLDEKLKIVPQLASALPDISGDGKTVTIKLRSGIKFNDGTKFDAARGQDVARPPPHAEGVEPRVRARARAARSTSSTRAR